MKTKLCFLLIVFASALAHAESGTVESVSGGTYQMTTNDFGDSKFTVLSTKLSGLILKSEVSFMKQGTTFVAECAGSSTTDSKGNKVDGTCLVTDSEGDKYKLFFTRSNVVGGSNPGQQNWVGLTGKYIGATAHCTYENKSQVLNSVVYGINPVKCVVTK